MIPRAVAPFLALVLALTSTAAAQNANWPDQIDDDANVSLRENMPDDPGFYSERYDGETLLEVGGSWNLWSFIPQLWIDTGDPIRPEEITLGTGMHADRAWLLSTGRRDVLIAVLDSGVYWDNLDLVNKYYLNPGELDRDGARPCVPAEFDGDPMDVDGSGFFNIQDYTLYADECTWSIDDEGNDNDLIDPQDLLLSARYADGVDDDGNGYLDDLSGWDFYWNDNDAYDEVRFGHGNGEADDSGAEGNNGRGGIGVCPECTLLMLRVGDSFVTDSNDFGAAVAYAVDSGASVIQEALGTINNTPLARRAIEYAYQNNVVVIASAADELSFHHNMPGTNNHTVYVHAIVHDRNNRARATTFLNYNNCTNHGAQLVLSTPGGGCSSEATGKTSGQAGLIVSYARELALDPPLSAEEVRGLMIMSVDDIDVAESQPDHPSFDGTKFPSGAGWDFHFGYGRNNVRGSLELLRDDLVPPEVDIVSPVWFEPIDPLVSETIAITGRIGTRVDGLDPRYGSYDWTLAVAVGVEPGEDDFDEVGGDTTTGLDGVIATLDSDDFQYDGVPQEPHDFVVTVRLRACVTGSGSFGAGGNCSEFRKAFFVHRDPDLHDGFPRDLGASGETSPIFVDLDGDGADELIVPTSEGVIYVFEADGEPFDGWPVRLGGRKGFRDDLPNDHRAACAYRTAPREGCTTRATIDPDVYQTTAVGTPAVGNLEGDEGGDLEVVVPSFDGWVYAWHANGEPVEGFPVRTDPALSAGTSPTQTWDEGIAGAAVLYDLDDDDDLEIIVGAMDQHLYVWHHDGALDPGFPVYCRDFERDTDELLSPSEGRRIFGTPAVGDLDNDGFPEILVGTNEVYDSVESRYYIVHHDGNDHANGPFEFVNPDAAGPGPGRNFSLVGEVLPMVGRGIPTAPTLADIDFDGYIEFAVEGVGGQPVMRRWDGIEITDVRFMNISTEAFGPDSDVEDDFSYTLINHGAFGYLDDSGDLAYLKGAAGIEFALAFAEGGEAATFDHQLAAWNTRTALPLQAFPRAMEDWQFFVSPTIVDLDDDTFPEVVAGSGGYLLRAFNYRGEELAGWPKQTGGWIIASAAVGDFDGDDFYDVAVTTRSGYLFVWRTPGTTDGRLEWSGFGHDPWNTFNYETPIPGRDGPQPPGDGADEAEPVDTVEPSPDTGPGDEVLDGGGDSDLGDSDTAAPPRLEDDGCCSVTGGSRRSPWVLALLGVAVVLGHRRLWRR